MSFASYFFFEDDAKAEVQLDITIGKVATNKAICRFKYYVSIKKNDTFDFFKIPLQFPQNAQLTTSFISQDPNSIVTYGFNSIGEGGILIEAQKKPINVNFEFFEVELPVRKAPDGDNEYIVLLDFASKKFDAYTPNLKICRIDKLFVKGVKLSNSSPKFQLVEKEVSLMNLNQNEQIVYFVIPGPRERALGTFFTLLLAALIIGFIGSVKLLQGKTQYIWGLILSGIGFIYFVYTFFAKIIPTDFTKDIDMISLVGGVTGLLLGILSNSVYNLIRIRSIENLQR